MIPWIGAAIQGATGLAQMIGGLSMKNKRPDYVDNDNINKQETLARNRLKNPYAGADKAVESADLGMANNIDAIRSGKAGGRVDEAALFNTAASNRLAVSDKTDANTRLAEASLSDVLTSQQGYQEKKWDYNKNQPFQEKAALKSSLIGAGAENMFGAAGDFADEEMQKDYLGGGTRRRARQIGREQSEPVPEKMTQKSISSVPGLNISSLLAGG